MITEYTSLLIPAAVAAGKFPKADEDKLTGLAAHWQKIGTEISGDGDAVTSLSRTVFANWSGSGADAASAQISQVSRFATSLAAATGVISKGCTTGASYVTNTKNGINVVLIQLDNLTKAQILIGLADPLQVPICLIRIIELRKRARALISAYYDALTSAMGSIPFAVTIQPRPKRATTASTATSGTAQGSVGQGGTGGGGGTSSATSTSTASATGGSATGSHGDVAAPTDSNAWTGDLAGYQDLGNTAAVIGTVPARTDATTGSGSGTTQDTTGTHGPKHTDGAPGTAPTSTDTSVTSAPTGTDSLTSAHDLNGAFSGGTPAGQTPTAGTPGQGGPTVDGHHHTDSTTVSAGTKQDILDTVTGKNDGQSVADTLTPTSGPHGHSGGASSGPPAAGDQLTQTSGQAMSQVADVRHAEAATSSGATTTAPSTWSGTTPSGSSVSVPAAGATEIPAGTGAAGTSTTSTTTNTPPPVMPISGSNAFMGAGTTPTTTSLGPNIQIAPGSMSPPVTTSGAFGGLSSPAATGPLPAAAAPAPMATGPVPNAAVPSASVPPAPVPSTSSTPPAQAGPAVTASQPLRIDTPRGGVVPTGTDGGADPGVVTVASAIVTLGLVGVAAQHFAGLWQDLGTSSVLRPVGAVLPTQFGRDDELLAAMPLGMETVYQKVLLPGEIDQLFAGQVETIRGLVYPYESVRGLHSPAQLYDTLGLGFAVTSIAGSDTLAFNRDADTIEVLRCTGLRSDDLVTPIEADVHLPAGTVPAPLVRHHKRPWIGTGVAPGSTSGNVIEEHEILGYASVGIPHLAEIWRLHADGREEYVSTYNQRNGQWLGDSTPSHQPIGRRIDNGAYATLSDGTVFRSMVLTERHSVLIAYGVSAPEHFAQVHDGSCRLVVENSDIISLMGVTTIGVWRALPVQLLHRQGDMLLVDHAGDDPIAAAAAGFPQTNQGQWQPRWVEHTEVTDVQELERPYPLPRAVVTSQTSDVPVGARS